MLSNQSRLRLSIILALTIATLSGGAVWAKRTAVPDTNIFSDPAGSAETVPTYVRNNKPLNNDKLQKPANFNQLKLIPDLSDEQSKAIEACRKAGEVNVGPLRDQIGSLQEQINLANNQQAPPMIMVDGKQMKLTDSLRNQINNLRKQIDAKQQEQMVNAFNLLTDSQKQELERIRSGQWIINGAQNAYTNSSMPKDMDSSSEPMNSASETPDKTDKSVTASSAKRTIFGGIRKR